MRSRRWNRAVYARRAGMVLGAAAALVVPLVMGAGSPARADAGTGTIAVCLTNSQGENVVLGADQAWDQANGGSIAYIGGVGNSGCRESSFADGASVAVWVATQGTYSEHRTVTATSGETKTVNFYTTDVTIQYPGAVAFGGSQGQAAWFKSGSADASKELLSDGTNPTMFRMNTPAGQVSTPVSWPVATGPGASASFSLMALQVLNNDGTGEAGASALYKTAYTYHVPGSTNSNGLLGWAHSGLLTDVTVTAGVNDTTSTDTEDVSTTGLFRFQTTNLTLNYHGGEVIYKGAYLDHFSLPSMEMFPGTYAFRFSSGAATGNPGSASAQTYITVPEPAQGPVVKTAAVVRFQDSTGAGLVGSVSYYMNGWHNPAVDTDMGATWGASPASTGDQPGSAVLLFDGAPTNVVFALGFQGERQQLPRQNLQTDSVAYFHTTDVAVGLLGSNGLPLRTGGASYYASGWHGIGDTSNADANGYLHQQMLPGSYSFAMTYKGTREQLNHQSVGGDSSTVAFQATDVTVALVDHAGDAITDGDGAVSYYAGGWHTVGATNTSGGHQHMQMLPGSYSFAMTYKGTREQLNNQSVGSSPSTVSFQTGQVVSSSGTATSYYADGWKSFDNGMELLPGSYWFHFNDGTPQTKETLSGATVNIIH